MSNTTAAPGTEPRAYHLRPEEELIAGAVQHLELDEATARRERIERRAWELVLTGYAHHDVRAAIEASITFDQICQELIP